jgi:hypothetical protein
MAHASDKAAFHLHVRAGRADLAPLLDHCTLRGTVAYGHAETSPGTRQLSAALPLRCTPSYFSHPERRMSAAARTPEDCLSDIFSRIA